MAIENRIQLGREAQVFVKKETYKGTYAFPTATDLIIPAGGGEFNQPISLTDSAEVRDSRSLKDQFRDMTPAGNWSLPMYCRPSGTKGAKPDGAALLEAAFGNETISAGSSVTYTLGNDLPSISITVKMKDMVWALVGASVNELRAALTNKGAINLDFSGGFMKLMWAGKAEIASASGTTVTLDDLADTQKFRPGMRIQFYDVSETTWFHNSGEGYTITAVDETGFTLTIDPTITEFTPAADDIVQGYIPTGTEVGEPIQARTGTCEMDTTAVPIVSMDMTLTNNIAYMEDEISTDEYPIDYIADRRSVKASATLYLRTNDLKYFRRAQLQTSVALTIKGGDTDGKKMELSIPYAKGDFPAISGDLQKQIAVGFTGVCSANYEDELSLKFL